MNLSKEINHSDNAEAAEAEEVTLEEEVAEEVLVVKIRDHNLEISEAARVVQDKSAALVVLEDHCSRVLAIQR
jgi:hypothetical protein